MLDSINIAASGLNSFQQGLRVLSDNVTNMNTAGFKGSVTQFGDVYLTQDGTQHGVQTESSGSGVEMRPPLISFTAGTQQQTGRDLDAALTGPGFFVVHDKHGETLYTKNGHFQVDANGALVTMDDGYAVMGLQGEALGAINLGEKKISRPKATTNVTLTGNLSAGGNDHTIDSVKTYDSLGGLHTLTLKFHDPFKDQGNTAPSGTWNVTVSEGQTTLATGNIQMTNSKPDPTADRITVPLKSADQTTTYFDVILGSDVTGFSGGSTSSLAVKTSDGYTQGTISQVTIDSKGTVQITYTNTQTATGGQLALAEFNSPETLLRASGAYFKDSPSTQRRLVTAGTSTTLTGGSLELSNVDLTDQFSTMVLVQRGFQASSQVLTTASEMIQSLFDIKSHR